MPPGAFLRTTTCAAAPLVAFNKRGQDTDYTTESGSRGSRDSEQSDVTRSNAATR